MGKIFYIMGKSASGKDTIYKELIEKMPKFHSIVPYTTRPMREGEKDTKAADGDDVYNKTDPGRRDGRSGIFLCRSGTI